MWNPANYVDADEPHRPVDSISEDEYFDVRRTAGSLIIAEFGCGAFHRLVVTGPARGQVWFDDRASDGGLSPQTDFRTWYEGWLEDQPASLRRISRGARR
ncbi:hypothetical protein [Pseudonocardia sp. TRM90224]|uniref:hypothetical protein n=1 Tax=Pseudonocardia sp. TRM90224 TaxID=2812678 RepID=UPI001E324EE1|nr:hypothetical protein [Pseudonocardia sp. TRM90224]